MRRSTLALDLWQYGEEAAADAAFRISSEDFDRICERTYELASNIPDGAPRGMMFAKAGALAGIEVIEGSPRPLARNRRRGRAAAVRARAARRARRGLLSNPLR